MASRWAGTAEADSLGSLSRRYEVGNRGPGAVSHGRGDPGGVSYGSYQLASRLGNARRFLEAEGRRWLAAFAGHAEGSEAFSVAWRAVAAREPAIFAAAQHAFVRRTHYEPQVRLVRRQTGIDLASRSLALRNVAWSVAVQHGPGSQLIVRALEGLDTAGPDFDRRAIEAIYAERARLRPDGLLAYFPRSSPAVQRGLARRFRAERADALAMLAAELG